QDKPLVNGPPGVGRDSALDLRAQGRGICVVELVAPWQHHTKVALKLQRECGVHERIFIRRSQPEWLLCAFTRQRHGVKDERTLDELVRLGIAPSQESEAQVQDPQALVDEFLLSAAVKLSQR